MDNCSRDEQRIYSSLDEIHINIGFVSLRLNECNWNLKNFVEIFRITSYVDRSMSPGCSWECHKVHSIFEVSVGFLLLLNTKRLSEILVVMLT